MLGQPIQWSHVGILAKTHSRYAIRGGSGLIFLLAFLFVGLAAAGLLIDPLKSRIRDVRDQVNKQNPNVELKDEDLVKQIARAVRPIVNWWIDGTEEYDNFLVGPVKNKDPKVEYLVVEKPPVLSAYFLIIMFFVPFTACLGAFNQLAGDIGTKGLRYLLLRTERINVFVSRFLGTVLFVGIIKFAVVLLVVTYVAISFDSHSFGELLLWGIQGWFALMLFSLPYICLCTLFSAILDSALVSLVLSLLGTGLPILMVWYAGIILGRQKNVDWLSKLTPWGWKYDLLHPELTVSLAAGGMMLLFSAAFWLLAARCFLKRDL